MNDQPFTIAQRAELTRMGFTVLVDVHNGHPEGLVRGAHRVVARYNRCDDHWEFEPWTAYWNPGVRFADPIAAVAWAEVEGWGEEFRGKWHELSAKLRSLGLRS